MYIFSVLEFQGYPNDIIYVVRAVEGGTWAIEGLIEEFVLAFGESRGAGAVIRALE